MVSLSSLNLKKLVFSDTLLKKPSFYVKIK